MRVSRKPSVFDERSGIGSPEELNEYGVWVKSKPEDLPEDEEPFGFVEDEGAVRDDFDPSLEYDDDFAKTRDGVGGAI